MPGRIEDYALIGDLRTAALVGRDGSIDWLCLPQIDSRACFAALLGSEENGRWQIAPADPYQVRRHYRGDSLILETEFTTASGRIAVVDFMVLSAAPGCRRLVRLVVGLEGEVPVATQLVLRFGYGRVVPWVRRNEQGLVAVAGAEMVHLATPVALHGRALRTEGRFTVRAGERVPFVLTWSRSYLAGPPGLDADGALTETEAAWAAWSAQCAGRVAPP